MEELFILGSSYLAPNNKEWASNLKEYNSSFGNYGDWQSLILKRDAKQNVLLIMFVDDFMSSTGSSVNTLENSLQPFFELLEKSLPSIKRPLIVGISASQDFDLIRSAKGRQFSQKAFLFIFDKLEKLAQDYENLYLLDLNQVFGAIGAFNAFDNRNWYFAHCRLSAIGIREIAKSSSKILKRHYEAASKVLVLDCDNTIWGGVIGEDGLNGIVLGQDGIGQAFVDFQKEVKNLINQGILVVLSSKNNEDEVWNVFGHHNDMILTRDDIVGWRINWDEKSQNLKEIALELSLDLNSFVFWDDNPVERDKMKLMAPQVVTVDVPSEVFEWPSLLRNLFQVAKFKTTVDDKNKTKAYHKRAKFVRDINHSKDEFTYLRSIKLEAKIHSLDQSNISRAEQLCHKTNQFNLRSVRHSAQDLLSLNKLNSELCFLVSLNDIYGDHGVVGLVCMKQLNDNTAFLDTMLMSCRIFGRHLDSWMLKQALLICNRNGFENLIAGFVDTTRNQVAKPFFSNHSFCLLNQKFVTDELRSMILIQENEKLYHRATNIDNLPFEDVYE